MPQRTSSDHVRVLVIRTDDSEEHHDVARADRFRAIAKLIGAESLDVVTLRDGCTMIVDDLGWNAEEVEILGGAGVELRVTTPRRPLNAKATALYRSVTRPGTTHAIAGDVAIVRDDDFE